MSVADRVEWMGFKVVGLLRLRHERGVLFFSCLGWAGLLDTVQ